VKRVRSWQRRTETVTAPCPRGALTPTLRIVPRPPRVLVPGGIYHVTARGNNKLPIVRDEDDWTALRVTVGAVVSRYAWVCHAYCFMTNHFHLLVQTPEPNLSTGMQRLNGCYAQSFNKRHGTVGHLFQGRFGARLVESDAHFVVVVSYLAQNPVVAGVCDRPEDWAWSSFAATIGLALPAEYLTTDMVLGMFSPDRERAQVLLRAYVEESLAPERAA
jgi:putative transposase